MEYIAVSRLNIINILRVKGGNDNQLNVIYHSKNVYDIQPSLWDRSKTKIKLCPRIFLKTSFHFGRYLYHSPRSYYTFIYTFIYVHCHFTITLFQLYYARTDI